MEPILQEIFDGVVAGKAPVVKSKVEQALEAGIAPEVILNDAMIAAMREVGRRFEAGNYFVPEMLIAARAMKNGLAVLQPRMQQGQIKIAGKVIAGTVQGDLHDIGKNLVCMMLQGAGFEIKDLGTNVTPQQFVEAAQNSDAQIVALSALLTTTMLNLKETIAAFEKAGLRHRVKIMVGGAPVTLEFAQAIGADGFAPDASRAVKVAQGLIG